MRIKQNDYNSYSENPQELKKQIINNILSAERSQNHNNRVSLESGD